MSWFYRKSKKLGPLRWTLSHSRRGPRLTAGLRVWPLSVNSRGQVRFSAFGFTKILRRGCRWGRRQRRRAQILVVAWHHRFLLAYSSPTANARMQIQTHCAISYVFMASP